MATTNRYSKSERNGKLYTVTQVIENSETFELRMLTGTARITHWGGNGRFRFVQNGIEYTTEFAKFICFTGENETREYQDYFAVNFVGLQPDDWRGSQYSANGPYWQPVPEIIDKF